jgi:hypothetical protein
MARTGDRVAACRAAAAVHGKEPRRVVAYAGALAAAKVSRAEVDVALTGSGAVVALGHPAAAIVVPRGAPFPAPSRASPVPLEVARRVVAATIQAATPPRERAADLACGAGVFLVALDEAGVRHLYGVEPDPAARAVAAVAVRRATLVDRLRAADGPFDLVVGQARGRHMTRSPRRAAADDAALNGLSHMMSVARPGALVGAVVPAASLRSDGGRTRRRQLVERHALVDLAAPLRFPDGSEHALLVARAGGPSEPLPAFGVAADQVAALDIIPFDPSLWPEDVDALRRVRSRSVALSVVCDVEAGAGAGGPRSGAWRTAGRPRVVLTRGRRDSARVDDGGSPLLAGQVAIAPHPGLLVSVEQLAAYLSAAMLWGVMRLERGPRWASGASVWRQAPVPALWLDGLEVPLERAWGLDDEHVQRLIVAASVDG